MPRKLRVFLDTSALLAGLNSPTGAAGIILAACFLDKISPLISAQVLEEVERNIPLKSPYLHGSWGAFLLLPLEIVEQPSEQEVGQAYKIIKTNDAPILAAAIKAKPDALVTWDIKHFLQNGVREQVDFPVLKPEEFIEQFM